MKDVSCKRPIACWKQHKDLCDSSTEAWKTWCFQGDALGVKVWEFSEVSSRKPLEGAWMCAHMMGWQDKQCYSHATLA